MMTISPPCSSKTFYQLYRFVRSQLHCSQLRLTGQHRLLRQELGGAVMHLVNRPNLMGLPPLQTKIRRSLICLTTNSQVHNPYTLMRMFKIGRRVFHFPCSGDRSWKCHLVSRQHICQPINNDTCLEIAEVKQLGCGNNTVNM